MVESSILPHEQCADELQSVSKDLEVVIHTYGPWDVRVGNAFCTLGNIYAKMGMLPEALAMFEKDLQVTRHSVHDSDLRVAGAKYNVGMTSCKVGRYSQALAYLEDALRTRVAALGPNHPEVADVLTCIGGVYSYTARHAEALRKYEEATAIRRAALGPRDATVALSLENSASARACTGQLDKVRALRVNTALTRSPHWQRSSTRQCSMLHACATLFHDYSFQRARSATPGRAIPRCRPPPPPPPLPW